VSRLEPDLDHGGSPARPGLTDLFAVVGSDALTRLRRLREENRWFFPFLDVAARQGRI